MVTFQSAMFFWFSASLLPLLTSVAYFRSSPTGEPVAQRLAVSAHGVAISALCIGAVAIGAFGSPRQEYGNLFGLLCWVPVALIGYSFWRFRGNKQVHLLQAINLLWLLAAVFLGGMAVSGVWL